MLLRVRARACKSERKHGEAQDHLDAPDEKGARLLDARHQPRQLPLELLADRRHLSRRLVVLGREDGAGARVGAPRQHVVQVAREAVGILLEHAAAVVHDVARVVAHEEGGRVDRLHLARASEDARAALPVDDLCEELLVAALRHAHLRAHKGKGATTVNGSSTRVSCASRSCIESCGVAANLLVEQVHEAVRLCREKLDDGAVVEEWNLVEGHALRLVERLLLRERVRVELLLQTLVGEVDAELLAKGTENRGRRERELRRQNGRCALLRPCTCSNELTSKISKPKMSSTPMDMPRSPPTARLMRCTRSSNMFEYAALARASTASYALSTVLRIRCISPRMDT